MSHELNHEATTPPFHPVKGSHGGRITKPIGGSNWSQFFHLDINFHQKARALE